MSPLNRRLQKSIELLMELEFRGWGIGEETWGLSYEVLAGDPSTKALWDTLDQHLERTFTYPSG